MSQDKLKILFFGIYFLLAPYVGYKIAQDLFDKKFSAYQDKRDRSDGERLAWQIEAFQKFNPNGGTLPLPGGRYIIDRAIVIHKSTHDLTLRGQNNNIPLFEVKE